MIKSISDKRRPSEGKKHEMAADLPQLPQCAESQDWREIVNLVQQPGLDAACARDPVTNASPLHYVAFIGRRPSYVGLLLTRGADPNACTRDGLSPLFAALLAPTVCLESLRLLLLHGADVRQKYGGVSALCAAAHRGCAEAVRLLLESGAKVGELSEVMTGHQSTALAVAIVTGAHDVALLLVDRGGADLGSDESSPSVLEQASRLGLSARAMRCLRLVQDKATVRARKAVKDANGGTWGERSTCTQRLY